MRQVPVPSHLCRIRSTACRRTLLAAGCLSVALLLAGCSGGGIYANIGIAGPSVDLGPVSVRTGVNLGRWL
ncbi:hypothetical protein [Thioalkalivibrio sp.]|uniref:hypothetical protein n=1 Tax=Thioalkalivibrio sp. TaxID=2093813 RepID=UPI003567BF94